MCVGPGPGEGETGVSRLDPALESLGAAAGFGVGIALTLRLPEFPDQMKRRMVAVSLAIACMLLLLLVATPAGVLTGAVLPALMVGFADEYGAWRQVRGDAHT